MRAISIIIVSLLGLALACVVEASPKLCPPEPTLAIPEHSDLQQACPTTDWTARARALGATDPRPASSGAEENLLCENGDRYAGENIFIHEFGHTILLGLKSAEPRFIDAL